MRFSLHYFRNLALLLMCLPAASGQLNARDDEVIRLWYGKEQVFGGSGEVQRYVNVLGNVDPGMGIVKLDFALNGGPFRPLSIGPDTRRLQRAGDFNIEIETSELSLGKNTVLIQAMSGTGNLFEETLELEWAPVSSVPDRVIEWGKVKSLMEVAQPIDGLWRVEGDKVVSALEASGYDRILGIGDMDWADYEVLFPFEVRGMDMSTLGSETSVGPALLVLLRWMGHTDAPVRCEQPSCGWEPFGTTINYSWADHPEHSWTLSTHWKETGSSVKNFPLETDKPYWLRARAETTLGGNLYSLKLWQGTVGDEPAKWSAKTLAGPLNLQRGSFLLVAHHIDLAVGTIQFTQLGTMRNTIVKLLTESTDLLVQLPYLFLWLAGIVWAVAFSRRDPKRGKWVLFAFCLLFATTLVGFLLLENLPDYLQAKGWMTRRVNYVYVLIQAIPIGGHLIAWAVFFRCFWPSGKPASS